MFVVKIDDIAVRIRSIATSNGDRCKLPTKTNKEIITGPGRGSKNSTMISESILSLLLFFIVT